MQTDWIPTGPHGFGRSSHFEVGNTPTLDRFKILAIAFWARLTSHVPIFYPAQEAIELDNTLASYSC
jgi:hypothetical protein